MRRFCSLVLTMVAALSLGACAVGVKHEYEQLTADVRVKSSQIALGVHDQRPYVLDGTKKEDFTGVTRGGFNNPFDASTASGKPMADDFARAIAESLTRNGAKVSVVRLEPKLSKEEAIKRLAQSAPKAVLLSVKEWKTDLGYSFRHVCELKMSVIGHNGTVLASQRIADGHVFQMQPLDLPRKMFAREVPGVFKQHMEQLFSSPGIASAL
jgi:hypothetical protein